MKQIKYTAAFQGEKDDSSADGQSLLTTEMEKSKFLMQAHCCRCGMTWAGNEKGNGNEKGMSPIIGNEKGISPIILRGMKVGRY